MRVFKNKNCKECGVEFTPVGPCSLYCSNACLDIATKRSNRAKNARSRVKQGRLVGVGSGNAQGRGENHHSYKSGIKGFSKRKLDSMVEHMCEECNLDLTDIIKTSRYMWAVHHIDEDRSNNALENLRLLCKKCHQLVHECQNNFHKV